MRIFVLIKQVPGTSKVEVDRKTGVLKRDGVVAKINPYDLFAIEAAVRIREALGQGAAVTAISMGPAQAERALREALAMGADEAILVSDRRFGGADVLATARALSQAIEAAGGADLILCGLQTTDGDTGQVGPEVAEMLAIPHMASVAEILEAGRRSVTVKTDLPDSVETVRLPYPCLLAVAKDLNTPRLPSYRRLLETRGKKIRVITLDDLPDKEPAHYGLRGSATRVVRIFPPEHHAGHELWQGPGEELGRRLAGYLADAKFISR